MESRDLRWMQRRFLLFTLIVSFLWFHISLCWFAFYGPFFSLLPSPLNSGRLRFLTANVSVSNKKRQGDWQKLRQNIKTPTSAATSKIILQLLSDEKHEEIYRFRHLGMFISRVTANSEVNLSFKRFLQAKNFQLSVKYGQDYIETNFMAISDLTIRRPQWPSSEGDKTKFHSKLFIASDTFTRC